MNRIAKANLKKAKGAISTASDVAQTALDVLPKDTNGDAEENGDESGGLKQVVDTLGDVKDAAEEVEECVESVSKMKELFCCCGKKAVGLAYFCHQGYPCGENNLIIKNIALVSHVYIKTFYNEVRKIS